jgi:MipA family protein
LPTPDPVIALRPRGVPRAASQRVAAVVLLAGVATAAAAAAPITAEEPLWELGLGAAALSMPHYRGSDQRFAAVLPLPYLVYRGEWLNADREGTRLRMLGDDSLKLDLGVGASPPTRSRDNRARQGLADLPPTVELGPRLSLHLLRDAHWDLALRLPLLGTLTLQRDPQWLGWSAAPALNLDWQRGAWSVGGYAGPLWQSQRLHAHYYSVPASAATAERPAYDAAGGYAGWRAVAGLSHREGALWWGAFARLDSVAGARFADSPLVRQRQNWSFGLAAAWIFARSGEAAAPPARGARP